MSFLDKVNATINDVANYTANLAVNSVRSVTVGHEYVIDEKHLHENLDVETAEAAALYSNELLEFYEETPVSINPSIKARIDSLSDSTAVAGSVIGGGAVVVGGTILTIGAASTSGPIGAGLAAGASTLAVQGGLIVGECAGASAGSTIEHVINLGFESPRKLMRDLLEADIKKAAELGINPELIIDGLYEQLQSHKNSFSNGELINDRSFDARSLINNIFVQAGFDVPKHEDTPLAEYRENIGSEKQMLIVPVEFKESYSAPYAQGPICEF
ncbi:MAG: hypothetical protein ACLFR0_03465 [Alphaproteobacteria bacterium]